MGISGIWQWVVILIIVLLLFGTKRLRNVGSDLGSAIKGFRKGVADGGADGDKKEEPAAAAVEKTAEEEKQRRDGGKADG